MKTNILKSAFVIIASICFSCSSDSDENAQQIGSLRKTEVFYPQMSGFTSRTVSYFQDNKPVADTTFNSSGTMTAHKKYTYTSSSATAFFYNNLNALTDKRVYTYDNAKRITNVDVYNAQNQLTLSKEYQYNNHDINLYNTISGTPILVANFKTNTNNLVYIQEEFVNGEIRTMSYNNDLPTQMVQGPETMSYEFYSNMKPQDIQNTTNEINNIALLAVLDHVYFSCNYYLKQVHFPITNTISYYQRTFNADNYQTYMNIYIDYSGTIERNSETFFYYN